MFVGYEACAWNQHSGFSDHKMLTLLISLLFPTPSNSVPVCTILTLGAAGEELGGVAGRGTLLSTLIEAQCDNPDGMRLTVISLLACLSEGCCKMQRKIRIGSNPEET